jgi:hypothetical protein
LDLSGYAVRMNIQPAGAPLMKYHALYGLAIGSAVGIVAAVVDAIAHRAFLLAYAPPLVASLVVGIVLTVPSPRRLALAATLGAAVVALAAFGWQYPLGVHETEQAFARAHPNWARPIHCRRDAEASRGSLVGIMYVCRPADGGDGFSVRVDDTKIVQEYP